MKKNEHASAASTDVGVLSSLKSTRLGKIYVAYLSRYPAVRAFTAYIWRNTYPIYARYREAHHRRLRYGKRLGWSCGPSTKLSLHFLPVCLRHVKHRRDVRRQGAWVKLTKASEFFQAGAPGAGDIILRLQEASPFEGKRPRVFSSEAITLDVGQRPYDFPEVYCAQLRSATVYGATNIIFTGEHALHHDLYQPTSDYTSEEMHGRMKISPWLKRMRLLKEDRSPAFLQQGAAFVDACAVNYAHWITEVLPRVAVFCREEKFKNVPLIIDAGLHKNILASLRAVAGEGRNVIELAKGRALQVENLLVVSVCGYVPFQPRKRRARNVNHGKFNLLSLGEVRKAVYDSYKIQISQDVRLKIYIKRNSGIRNIINIDQIESEFLRAGYIIVEPEKLSFAEQVEVFSRADVVVGPAGAALANAIFARKGAHVGIFISAHESMLYGYWPNIMAASDIDVSYIMGESPEKRSVHDDFYVPVEHVRGFISEFLN